MRQMDREKFWGALVAALDEVKIDPEIAGSIVTMVMRALDYAEETSPRG